MKDHGWIDMSLYLSTVIIHVETTHTWLQDFSFHGNSTAKMGLPGKQQSAKRGRRHRAGLRKNKLVKAGVLCTAHVCF